MMSKKRIPLMVPDIGDAERIEVVGWNVQPGQSVSENDELCELVTDKAAFPLECPHTGQIIEITQPRGSTVKVGDQLAILEIEEV